MQINSQGSKVSSEVEKSINFSITPEKSSESLETEETNNLSLLNSKSDLSDLNGK